MVSERLKQFVVAGAVLTVLIASASVCAQALDLYTEFYVPKPEHGAIEQIAKVTSSGLIRPMPISFKGLNRIH